MKRFRSLHVCQPSPQDCIAVLVAHGFPLCRVWSLPVDDVRGLARLVVRYQWRLASDPSDPAAFSWSPVGSVIAAHFARAGGGL